VSFDRVLKGDCSRREWLAGTGLLALASIVPSLPALAAVDTAKVTIPAGPGGGWDRTGRLTMQAMQKEKLVGAVQFTNRAGGAGTVGLTEFVRTTKGDDTALLFTGVIMMSSVITAKSPITIDMTTPLACLTREYVGIGVSADSSYKTIADLVAALKADPSSVTVGGSGVGSVEHLTLALMAQQNQVPLDKLNFITFSGNEYVPALVSGKIKAVMTGVSELKPLADAGRIRIIGVTSAEPLKGVDIPTLKSAGLDITVGNWRGVVGAPGMSDSAKTEWISKLDKLSKSPSWPQALAAQGLEDAYMSGDEFATFLKTENERWTSTLTELGLVK
jgi:putative tricarboxylic transport membrane protein